MENYAKTQTKTIISKERLNLKMCSSDSQEGRKREIKEWIPEETNR